MKRQGIWVGGVRWQNGHYQSIKPSKRQLKSIIYSLEDKHINIKYSLEDKHIDIKYSLR